MQLDQSVKVDHLENKRLYLPEATELNAVNASDCVELKKTESNANCSDVDVPNKDNSVIKNDGSVRAQPVQARKDAMVDHFENESLDQPNAMKPSTENVSKCAKPKKDKNHSKKSKQNVKDGPLEVSVKPVQSAVKDVSLENWSASQEEDAKSTPAEWIDVGKKGKKTIMHQMVELISTYF